MKKYIEKYGFEYITTELSVGKVFTYQIKIPDIVVNNGEKEFKRAYIDALKDYEKAIRREINKYEK